MSLTKQDFDYGRPDEPQEELGAEYEEWLDTLPPVTDEDLDRMAAQDEEYRRIKNAEAETGPCGQREGW